MNKKIIKLSSLVVLGIVIILIIVLGTLFIRINQKLGELEDYQSLQVNKIEMTVGLEKTLSSLNEDIDNLILQQDSIMSKLYELTEQQSKLEEEYNNLDDEIANIPVDETLIVRRRVEEWLDLFRDELEQEVDIKKVSQIMAVGPNYYYEWYPEFETHENMANIHHMMDVIFQYGEAVLVSPGFLLNNQYFVEDTDGNRFEIYYDGGEILSLFTFASLCENTFSEFVNHLKDKNADELYKYLFYESYGSYEDEIKYIKEEYLKPFQAFDLEQVDYRFDGIDMAGFRYIIFDQNENEMVFYINHSDSITLIESEEKAWERRSD